LLLQAGVALLQFVRQDDLGLRWLSELDLMTPAGGDSILFAQGQYWLRGYGLTPHPNILGGVLALFSLALIAPYLRARPRYQPLWLALLLLGLAGLFITFSRAAWLGGLVGGLFLLVGLLGKQDWRVRYGRSLFILLLASAVLLAGIGWQQRHLLFSRVTSSGSSLESRAVNERVVLAEAGLDLFRLAPLTGIGAGNTAVALIPLVAGIPKAGPQPVHNVSFLLAIELGLPGALLWSWLMIFPIGFTWQRWRKNQLTLWALVLAAALLAFAVIDLFDHYAWGWQQGRLLRWMFLGLWASAVGTTTN
jgi:O-antigen ligase